MSAALDTIADIYDRDGFVFPIDVVDPAEAEGVRADLERAEGMTI